MPCVFPIERACKHLIPACGTRRLYAEQLRERAGQLVLFGVYQSEIPNLVRDGLLTGGAVVWWMWDGYLNEPSGQRLQTAAGLM